MDGNSHSNMNTFGAPSFSIGFAVEDSLQLRQSASLDFDCPRYTGDVSRARVRMMHPPLPVLFKNTCMYTDITGFLGIGTGRVVSSVTRISLGAP